MAASDARFLPIKNQAYRITFPIFDADGDLVTGATGLDSEVSKDAGTFADCTNEATEIATSSGMYYLDLTASEMNADTVAGIVKTSTVGAKTTPFVLYPSDPDVYTAKIWMFDDNGGTTDRYVACWFKNGAPYTIGGGITSPQIQVIKAADGTDLIAATAMTEIGTTELYRYDATGASRTTSGVAYAAKITATIDGATRTWYQPVGRDS